MYRAYAKDPQARVNVGIRRRLAPLLGNDRQTHRNDERAPLLPARDSDHLLRRRDRHGRQHLPRGPQLGAHAHAMEQPTGTPASRTPTLNASICPSSSTRSTTRRRSTSRPRRRTRTRSCGGCGASSPFDSAIRPSDEGPSRSCCLTIARSSPSSAASGDERILCVFNLSRHVQCVELDLSEFRGAVPVELSGNQEFPPIGDLPYFITLGSHGFFWFSLEREPEEPLPRTAFLLDGRSVDLALRRSLRHRLRVVARDLHGRAALVRPEDPDHHIGLHRRIACLFRRRRRATGTGASGIPLAPVATILIVQLEFDQGAAERYVVPVAFVERRRGREHEEVAGRRRDCGSSCWGVAKAS